MFSLQIFVGGLDPNVSDEELRQIFAQFGELVYVKIPAGKGCGFVQFAARYVEKLFFYPILFESYYSMTCTIRSSAALIFDN